MSSEKQAMPTGRQADKLAQRVREAALEHPFAFALGLLGKSRKDAARLAREYGVEGEEERYVEDVAIFKRDAETLLGVDFFTALRKVLNNKEENEEMKVQWSSDHYRRESEKCVQKVIREVVEKTFKGRLEGFMLDFNFLHGLVYLYVRDAAKQELAVRMMFLKGFFEGAHRYHFGPVNIEVCNPKYLKLARELGKHCQKRACRQYKDQIVILKDW